MVNYQKTKSSSICEFLPFSLGMAVKLIWEGRFKGDFEEAADCLRKAFTQNVTTGVEGKAVELVSRMRGTTLGGERRIKAIRDVLTVYNMSLKEHVTMGKIDSLCLEILGLADQVEETIILKVSDLVMRPEMECKEDSDLVMRPGMEGGELVLLNVPNTSQESLNEIKQDVKKHLDKHFGTEARPLMDELTYEPVDENRFGPRILEGMLSAEDMDVFDGVQKYVPTPLSKEE